MTILTSQTVVGIDIAKAEIVVYRADLETIEAVKNDRAALKRWLKTLPAQSAIAVEATNIYHLETVDLAHAMGHQVYVVDAYRVSHYRRGVGQRAKNDPCDARVLARYLTNEQSKLRLWNPPPKAYTVLKSLLHRRATLIQNHTGLMLSWADEPLLKKERTAQQKAFERSDKVIQKLLRKVSKEAGIDDNIDRCKAIEGVGELTATGLATTYMRGDFANSDAFIAFLGMDLTVDDSGEKNGPRFLSKKGDPSISLQRRNGGVSLNQVEAFLRVLPGQRLLENTGIGSSCSQALPSGIHPDEESGRIPISLRF